MSRLVTALLIGCTGLPIGAQAAISISEVAWMGGSASANHEWIELHNSGGSAIDVTDWTLSDGANLTIPLSGTVPAGAYVLLKRTSDASVTGPTFLIYTGALVNTGATLTIRRADGTIADQVVGGENWQNIGGSNETKDTAQYTPSGWITAAPTPGMPNATTPSAPSAAATTTTTNSTQHSAATTVRRTSRSGEPVRLTIPNVELQLTIDAPTLGYVNQSIGFAVTPRGLGDTWLNSLTYTWNFGDGFGIASNKQTNYAFAFPGTYVVTVHAGYARHEQVARHEITILPTALSISTDSAGNVLVHNDAPYEVDISGFVIQGATRTHTFPLRTIMLPFETITLPRRYVGDSRSRLVAVYDQARTLVASNMTTVSSSGGRIDSSSESLFTMAQPIMASAGSGGVPAITPDTLPVSSNEPMVAGTATTAIPVASAVAPSPVASLVPSPEATSPARSIRTEWLLLALIVGGLGALALRPRTAPVTAPATEAPAAPPTKNPFL